MPAVRTVKEGDLRLRARDWILTGLATVIGPPLLGLPIGLLAYVLPPTFGGLLGGFGGLMMLAPFLTLFLVPIGLGLGGAALRRGYGGWAVAVVLPTVLTLAVVASFIPNSGYPWQSYGPQLAIFGSAAALHGGIMWLTLRTLCPAALAPR